MTQTSKLFIKQNKDSSAATIACRLVTDDDPQIQLVPDEWVKVATCDAKSHVLRVGTILGSGKRLVELELKGGTHNGKTKIEEMFFAPTDGAQYNIEVQ